MEKIVQLSYKARQRRSEYEEQRKQCQILAKEIQYQLGLRKPVFTSGVIRQGEYLQSLQRLQAQLLLTCNHDDDDDGDNYNNNNDNNNNNNGTTTTTTTTKSWQHIVKTGLAGNALGITGSGQFCHLADDGSVVIPHDWK